MTKEIEVPEDGRIFCPISKQKICIGECVVTVDVSEGCVKETVLSKAVTSVENWREICKNCQWHDM